MRGFCSGLQPRVSKSFYDTLCFLQVTRETHLYLENIEEREEGGTPAIVESIRAGMVFQLKEVREEMYNMSKIRWHGHLSHVLKSSYMAIHEYNDAVVV